MPRSKVRNLCSELAQRYHTCDWGFWCALVPCSFLSFLEFRSLFSFYKDEFLHDARLNSPCLLIPLAFAYGYAFPKAVKSATIKIILISLFLALVNGTMEEVLWRGLYLKLPGSDKWTYILVSAFGFAIWHFSPQLIYPNKSPGGRVSFVAFAFVLGILFSVVSFNTHSILEVTICHILFDFSGMGGRLYTS